MSIKFVDQILKTWFNDDSFYEEKNDYWDEWLDLAKIKLFLYIRAISKHLPSKCIKHLKALFQKLTVQHSRTLARLVFSIRKIISCLGTKNTGFSASRNKTKKSIA